MIASCFDRGIGTDESSAPFARTWKEDKHAAQNKNAETKQVSIPADGVSFVMRDIRFPNPGLERSRRRNRRHMEAYKTINRPGSCETKTMNPVTVLCVWITEMFLASEQYYLTTSLTGPSRSERSCR